MTALRRPLAVLCAVALLAGCATEPMPPPGEQADVSHSLGQPLRDLSLIREIAPEVLLRAAAAPYSLDGVSDCAGTQAEIQRLDLALGPDLQPAAKSEGVSVSGLAADLVSGAIGLPFRGVVRLMTGAQSREAALRAAVLAGMVRRGFLKGRLERMGCAPDKA